MSSAGQRRQTDGLGYLLVVLNTHQPFVRHPELEYVEEENWLFEAITESYLPVLRVLRRLADDGVSFRLTFSLTPCLISMLSDDLLKRRYVRYLDDRVRLADEESQRFGSHREIAHSARCHRLRLESYRRFFKVECNGDIPSAFAHFQDLGHVEILASSATHCYSPLWQSFPHLLDLQIRLGIDTYERTFGRPPVGFWLPECAFFPGLERLLWQSGIRYFFLDAHGLLNGTPRPKFGVYAPIHCPGGPAAFGRHWESHDQVWLKDRGYPGDPAYLNRDSDIAYERENHYLLPLIRSSHRVPAGVSYHSIGANGVRRLYDRANALRRCDDHASHFVKRCHDEVLRLSYAMGRRPVLAAMFDTEHFGHWWHEGPIWLERMVRKMACDQHRVRFVTAVDYLRDYPVNQVVEPSLSSWGYQGYGETWLMGRNHWIYPLVFRAIEDLDSLIDQGLFVEGPDKKALDQYIRELLLAQSSDWAFMLHAETAQNYAQRRVIEHVENMAIIRDQLSQGEVASPWLNSLEERNNIFAGVDLVGIYRDCRQRCRR